MSKDFVAVIRSIGDWLLYGGRALALSFGCTMDGAVAMLRLGAGSH